RNPKRENRAGLMVGFGCRRKAQVRAARLVYLARDAQTLRLRAHQAAAAAPLPAEWISATCDSGEKRSMDARRSVLRKLRDVHRPGRCCGSLCRRVRP